MKYFLLFAFFLFQIHGSCVKEIEGQAYDTVLLIVRDKNKKNLNNPEDRLNVTNYLRLMAHNQVNENFSEQFEHAFDTCWNIYSSNDAKLGNFVSKFIAGKSMLAFDLKNKYKKLVNLQQKNNNGLFSYLFILNICRDKDIFLKDYERLDRNEKNYFKQLLYLGDDQFTNVSASYIYKKVFDQLKLSFHKLNFIHNEFYQIYYLTILANDGSLANILKLSKNKKHTKSQICNIVKTIENKKLTKEVQRWDWIFELIDNKKFINEDVKNLFDILEIMAKSGNDYESFSRLFKNNITSILNFYNQYAHELKEPVDYFFKNILKQGDFNFSRYDEHKKILLFLYKNCENKLFENVLNAFLQKEGSSEYFLSCFCQQFESFFDTIGGRIKEGGLFLELESQFQTHSGANYAIKLNQTIIRKFILCLDSVVSQAIRNLLYSKKHTFEGEPYKPCSELAKEDKIDEDVKKYCEDQGYMSWDSTQNSQSSVHQITPKNNSQINHNDYVCDEEDNNPNDIYKDQILAQKLDKSLNSTEKNNVKLKRKTEDDYQKAIENSLIFNSGGFNYADDYYYADDYTDLDEEKKNSVKDDEDSDLFIAITNSLDPHNDDDLKKATQLSLAQEEKTKLAEVQELSLAENNATTYCDWFVGNNDSQLDLYEIDIDLFSLIINRANDKTDFYVRIDRLKLLQDCNPDILNHYSNSTNNPPKLKRCWITENHIKKTTKENLASCIKIFEMLTIIDENTQFKIDGIEKNSSLSDLEKIYETLFYNVQQNIFQQPTAPNLDDSNYNPSPTNQQNVKVIQKTSVDNDTAALIYWAWLCGDSDGNDLEFDFDDNLLNKIIKITNENDYCPLLDRLYKIVEINNNLQANTSVNRCQITKNQMENKGKVLNNIISLRNNYNIIDENTQFNIEGNSKIFPYKELITQVDSYKTKAEENIKDLEKIEDEARKELLYYSWLCGENNGEILLNLNKDSDLFNAIIKRTNNINDCYIFFDRLLKILGANDDFVFTKCLKRCYITPNQMLNIKDLLSDIDTLNNDYKIIDENTQFKLSDHEILSYKTLKEKLENTLGQNNQEVKEIHNIDNRKPVGQNNNVPNNINNKQLTIISLFKDPVVQKNFLFFFFGSLIIHLLYKQIQKYKIQQAA